MFDRTGKVVVINTPIKESEQAVSRAG